MRVLIDRDPYTSHCRGKHWAQQGIWPCRWIGPGDAATPPFVAAYRRGFSLDHDETIRVHVTADERYELFLDGVRVGRGPERGDRFNWFYETYDFQIPRGRHVFVARVWSLGDRAPYAQMSLRPGFLFSPEGRFIGQLGTGVAAWDTRRLEGVSFVDPTPAWGTGANVEIDAARFPWGFEKGEGDGWVPATVLHEGRDARVANEVPPIHLLRPALLPAMMEREIRVGTVRFVSAPPSADTQPVPIRGADHLASEAERWNILATGASITIPAYTRRRVIIDLDDYYCAYPEVTVSGGRGGLVVLRWAESLFENVEKSVKGNRNEIDGKFFWGVGDTFRPDGGPGRRFETLWWQAGRYLELDVETTDESLTIDRLALRETRYPLEMESRFQADDDRFNRVIPIAVRGLQMCSHETYMDCPYYEQLMYVGDTRLEVLTTYAISRDDRLPRKALRTFDSSRTLSGLTRSRYPSRVHQDIPPFSLWWVAMVHDFAGWRGDAAFVKSLLPGVRAVLDAYLGFMNADGLIQAPNGWNFMDWVPTWDGGVPPEGELGVNSLINWQMVYALKAAAELEEWLDEPELAARDRRLAAELAERVTATFWDDARQLFADDPAKQAFSEHSQCLAILAGELAPKMEVQIGRALVRDPDLARTTIYFTHYLFEAYGKLGLMDAFFSRMSLWFDLARYGFKTTFETPEPSRSDCHAWGAHPLFHYFATILGIRPVALGGRQWRIRPQLGPLTTARGTLVHPQGDIDVDLRREGNSIKAAVTWPQTLEGTFTWNGQIRVLKPGRQELIV